MPFPYSDLREYLAEIEAAGELIRIKAEVSSELEITEITDRVSKSLGSENKALLFENVLGYEIPVLINLMGSHKRLEMGLGVGHNSRGYDAIGERIRSLIKPELPFTLKDKIDKLLELSELRHIIPKKVSKAACQEVVILAEDSHSVKGREGQKLLDKLPILKCWPEDG